MQLDPDLLALQEVRTKVERASAAAKQLRGFTQERIDAIVERAGAAAREHSLRLARLAVEETGMGRAEDKHTKNLLSADLLPRTMRGQRTVGIIREDAEKKVVEIAIPMGVVAAILPTTNPTSTAIYKVLIALKAANSIVLSPHPRAVRCTCDTATVLSRAAVEAGAPEGAVECLGHPTHEATNALMRHPRTAVILSTGGSGIVRAAYSSGKPAFGVGPGNVPVLVDTSAALSKAVASVAAGKTFDYGTVCSSEQMIVAERKLREPILSELRSLKAYFCSEQQQAALTKVLLVPPHWGVNPQCVGQPAVKIAKMAGIDVPPDTSLLVVEVGGIGKEHPLSAEKLSPVLSLHFVECFPAAIDACAAVLRFGGLGHTCAIYATDEARIREYAVRMPAMRILVNTPTPHGATGITTNLFPAMTLGCGAIAGNITGDNIGPQHLVNVKRLAYVVRDPDQAFETALPPQQESSRHASNLLGDAVERYLAQRGFGAPAAASVVDRFLSRRKKPETQEPAVPALPQAAPEPAPPVAPPPISAFVSENDVRAALHRGQKIYIGPKTIVTPSARELGNQHDILVMAERK